MRYAPSGEYNAHEKQEKAPLRTLAARNADNAKKREYRSEHGDKNAGTKICGARLLVSCPPALNQIIQRRNVCLAATTTATTQANLCDALMAKTARARLAIGNRINSRMVVTLHSVRSGLTTQAQRPGARDATIATTTPPTGSLQRMVRCHILITHLCE